MSFAEQVVRDATAIAEKDVARLREFGLDDAEIFDIAAAASARCFFSKLLDAVGAEPDAPYARMDAELRRHLTVGRAVSEAAVERVEPPSK
jgi:hypothetical protein